jgi:hypothetical protein
MNPSSHPLVPHACLSILLDVITLIVFEEYSHEGLGSFEVNGD